MDRLTGYDREAERARKGEVDEAVRESEEARQQALEAVGRVGWREGGRLYPDGQ